MAIPSCTFSQLVDDLGALINGARNSSTGALALTPVEKADYAARLTKAARWVWQEWQSDFCFPCTLDSGSKTPSSGVVAWSDIDYSTWFSFWDEDPRDSYLDSDGAGSAAPLFATAEADGPKIWTDDTPVYVFWRKPAPEFTHTAVDTSETYDTTGTLVWDSSSTGHVYKSIATGALGSALTDTTKWTAQSLPEELRHAVVSRAWAVMQRVNASQPSMGRLEQEECDREMRNIFGRAGGGAGQARLWLWHNAQMA